MRILFQEASLSGTDLQVKSNSGTDQDKINLQPGFKSLV